VLVLPLAAADASSHAVASHRVEAIALGRSAPSASQAGASPAAPTDATPTFTETTSTFTETTRASPTETRPVSAESASVHQYGATGEELLAVEQMQHEDGPFHGVDTFTVLRFLRGCKGSAKQARKRYANYLVWRVEEDVANIMAERLPDDVAVEAQLTEMYCPRILDGFDKLGRPVVYSNLRGVDFGWIARQGLDWKLLVRRHVRDLERILAAVNAAPRPELGHLYLLDLGGLPVRNLFRGWKVWMEQAAVGQHHYPELMGTVCILRGPPMAAWGLKQIQRFLDPDTAAKFELHSGNPLKFVREHLSPGMIPPELLEADESSRRSAETSKCDGEGAPLELDA